MTKPDIEKLSDIPGVGPVGEEKLNKAWIFTKKDLLVRGIIDLQDITLLDKAKSAVAMEYCRDQLAKSGEMWDTKMTASQLLEKRKNVEMIKLGCKSIDEITGGGFECRAVTELAGAFRSGKTQIAHTLAVTVSQSKAKGGLTIDPKRPATCLYIDTEGTCRPERMREIAIGRGFIKDDPKEISKLLDTVIVQRPTDPAHLIMLLEYASHYIKEANIRLIVVDSVAKPFRQMMQEMGQAGTKFRLLNKVAKLLDNLCTIHNLVIIYVNQVYDSMNPFDPGQKSWGGHVIGHAITYRMNLKKKSKVWVATTTDYPHMPEEDALFMITSKGIVDVKAKEKK